MSFFQSESAPREGEDAGPEAIPQLDPGLPTPNKTRTISVPFWAIVVALGLVVSGLLWPTLQRRLLQTSATPPVSKVALPDYKDVSYVSLSYAKIASSSTALISNFDGADPWVGTGIDLTDLSTPFQGQASLHLRSTNQIPATVTLAKQMDLTGIRLFEMYVRTAEEGNVESLKVTFLQHRSQKTGFQFPLAISGKGWLPARMPRDQFEAFGGATESTWSDIGSVVITLVARPRTEAKTNIDLFRGEGSPSLYSADWRIRDPQIIGMLPSAQGTVLLFRNVAGSFSAMSKVGDAKDFVLTAELTPLTPGRGGLFLRGNSVSSKGLSFVIGGIGSSTWQMMRTDDTGTTTIKEGSIENLTFRDDATYWLRATVKASWMTLAMSRDGKTFTTIGSIRDVTFPFGEVGLSAFDSAAYVVRKIDYQRL